jgi:hypothetical protein
MIRDGFRHECPETRSVIEFLEMAQFMDDDRIDQTLWEQRKTVIEIEIPLLRTAPPARVLVTDSDAVEGKSIMRIPFIEFPMH